MRRGKGRPRQVSEESQDGGERMEEGGNKGGEKREKLKDLRLRSVTGGRETGWTPLRKSEGKGTRDQAEKAQLGAAMRLLSCPTRTVAMLLPFPSDAPSDCSPTS